MSLQKRKGVRPKLDFMSTYWSKTLEMNNLSSALERRGFDPIGVGRVVPPEVIAQIVNSHPEHRNDLLSGRIQVQPTDHRAWFYGGDRVTATDYKLIEPQQCMMFGWKFGSKMPAIYMKRYGKHIDNAQAIMNGVVQREKVSEAPKPRACVRCKFDNSPASKFCNRCGALLDLSASADLDQRKIMLDRLLYGIAAEPEKFEELREALVKICRKT